ncbi:MAG: hypothetical protein PHW76_05905 [Alphaproteobacteria bacterium]|nr:hypothetical protein [Alphaproteobacteria bacterium]
MLDLSWTEVLVVGAVALVAVGPEDLPKVMYTVGQWARKARRFGADFHRAFEQVSYEAEIAEKLKQKEHSPPNDSAS